MKKNRFVAGYSPLNKQVMLIIEDYAFWVENQDALEASIESFEGRVRQQGMIINFDNVEDRTMFLLRWA
ncbi:hypothetical protein UFOVP328_182 [uncultured Caudovirales phage]|uniref:Uncharacterized protein n=1 Tax=uncultured Caudovirales phage TaxID=2100421 RepID=A0A6J5M1U5_9CAUD|nr:hypothetical protein UFOVP328_182 [uncultured Caudovirales phage]